MRVNPGAHLLPLVVSTSLALAGCARDVESPIPTPYSLGPTLVCNDQLTTPVTVFGASLTPAPVDSLTDAGGLALPDLWLERATGLDGTGEGDEKVDLDEAGGGVRWFDPSRMEFDVTPGLLVEGAWDLHVRNIGGEQGLLPRALAAVPPPALDSTDPGLVCLDQVAARVLLHGSGFLSVGDALSVITIGGRVAEADEAAGCFGVSGPSEALSCTDLSLALPVDALEAGVLAVSVTNPSPAACTVPTASALLVVPAPILDAIGPDLLCAAQHDNTLTLTGSGFVVLGDGTLPVVEIGDQLLVPDAASDCVDLGDADGSRSCATLTVTVAAQSVPDGVTSVSVTNPAPADCGSSSPRWIEVVPAPVLDAAAPAPECGAQGDASFTLTGSDFFVLDDGTTPTVQIGEYVALADAGSGCVQLRGPAGGQACDTLVVTVPAGSLADGVKDIVVTNPAPADGSTEELIQAEIVGAPTLVSVEPALECDAQGNSAFTLAGAGFVVLADGAVPTVSMGGYTAAADSAGGCVPLTGPDGGESCTTLAFTLPMGTLDAGLWDVFVANPAPAECVSSETVQVEIVSAPTLASASPDLLCLDEGSQDVTVTGTGFVVLADGTLPTVSVGSWTGTPTATSGCAPFTGTAGGQACSTLVVTLPQGALAEGVHAVGVYNPAPADAASLGSVSVEIVGDPVLSAVAPTLACDEQGDESFVLTGEGFLVLADGTLPTVTLGGYGAAPTSVSGCAALAGPAGGERCDTLAFDVPTGTLAAGVYDVSLTNPSPAACSTDTLPVEFVGAPSVASVAPSIECDAEGARRFTISGAGFVVLADGTTPTVDLGGYVAYADSADGCTALTRPKGGDLCDTLAFTLPGTALTAGVYDVTVTNPAPAECAASAIAAFELVDAPVLVSVVEDLACDEQGDTAYTLDGTGFVVLADGTMPTVAFGGYTTQADAVTGCTALTGPGLGETCTSLTFALPAGAVGEGVWDVRVTNPASADCATSASIEVEVVPAPSISLVQPDLECDAQGDVGFVVVGGGFVVLADGTTPTVEMGGYVALADAGRECVPLEGPAGGESCAFLDLTLPQDALGAGIYDVVVTNPAPAACVSTEDVQVEIVPAPTLATVVADLECDAQGDVTFTLSGTGFVVLDTGTTPTVDMGGYLALADSGSDCTPLLGPAGGQSCATLAFTLPAGTLAAGVYDVGVTNPEDPDCETTELVQVEVVPEPTLASVEPDLECDDQADVGFTLTGTGFIVLADGTMPVVDFGGTAFTADSSSGCVALLGPAGGESCDTLGVTVPATSLADGLLAVRVDNPAPADCSSTEAVYVEIVPTPVLVAVSPELECDDQGDQAFTLDGTGFVVLADGTLPTVTLGAYSAAADGASGCVSLGGPSGGQSCSALAFTLPAGTLGAGVVDVAVANPAPADCTTSEIVQVEIVPAPTLSSSSPPRVCVEQSDQDVDLVGTGFVVLSDGTGPTVDVGGVTAAYAASSTCTALTGPAGGESCTGVTATIPQGSLSAGTYDITLTNPSPAECESGTLQIEVMAAPELDALSPDSLCTGYPSTSLVLSGGYFVHDGADVPDVTIGSLSLVPSSFTGCTALSGTSESCTGMTVTIAAGSLATGTYGVTVVNPDGADCTSGTVDFYVNDPPSITSVDPAAVCEASGSTVTVTGTNFTASATATIGGVSSVVTYVDTTTLDVVVPSTLAAGTWDLTITTGTGSCTDTATGAITVQGEPSIFYVDPPVTYAGIQIEATAYVASVVSNLVSVSLVEEATGTSTSLSFTWDASDPDILLATIPSGLARGYYTLEMTDAVGCSPSLAQAIFVEDQLTVDIAEVDPPFGWTDTVTAVEITANDPAASGMTQFDDIPRVYLSPTSSSGTATALTGLDFLDATLLDAVVPDGLAVDLYDVLVVNPDGSIGLLADGFEVTLDAPPTVSSVSPSSVDPSTDTAATITGEDFRSPTVTMTCADATTGVESTATGTVTSSTATSIAVTLPSSSFTSGDICTVQVVNTDGTYVDFATISVSTSSGNLFGWSAGTSMNTARRAPMVVAGRVTSTRRFLYAIGGDSGSTATPLSSVEAASVDRYGELSSWTTLANPLPAGRTLSGVAIIDRFIYVVGGNVGGSAVSSVVRAEILDPLAAPSYDALSMEYGGGAGLTEGTWIYRVSALFPSTYATNPSGESLPSDPIVVRVPDVPDQIHLTLSWTEVSGASGYRVYRSPAADAGSGDEEWLADVVGATTLSYLDTGIATATTHVMLETGDVGEWMTIAALAAARQSPLVAVAVDPVIATRYYLYAAGGLGSASTALSTVQYLTVDVTDDETQDYASAWSTATMTLSPARYEGSAFVGTDALNSYLPAGETWIWFGGGKTASTTFSAVMQAVEVPSGGNLGAATTVDSMRARSGYGYGIASNNLYMFGARSGAVSTDGDSIEMCSGSSGGCSGSITDPPDLANLNALGAGGSLLTSRYLMGSGQESAVFFVVGGTTSTSSASSTTEYTHF